MKFRRRSSAILVLLFSFTTIARGQFSAVTPSVAQETQTRGYWVDPSTGLMWAAKDNGKRVSWHRATKYCLRLRLAGFSDWKLASIDQLEGLVNLKAYATQRVGDTDILHWNSDLQVDGGLLLTGDRQWSSSPLIDVDGRPDRAHYWYFDFRRGWREKGFEDIAEGDTAYALCVRESNAVRSNSSNGVVKTAAQPPAENQGLAQGAQSLLSWTDPSTGLMWTVKDNGRDVNLGEAMKYCRDLRLSQYSDWRLATIEELEEIRRTTVRGSLSASKQEDKLSAYRLPEKLFLTGDPWSSSPASDARGYFSIEWFLSLKSKTRLFDEPSYSHDKRALCVRNSTPQHASRIDKSNGNFPSSSEDQKSAQQTQEHGYWIDSSTGLMWTGKDNLHNFIIYSEATRYCRDLRLAHYTDWRLATIEELQRIYDPKALSPGEIPRSHHHGPEPLFFHVRGDLFLTGMEWGRESQSDTGTPSEGAIFFDFQNGTVIKDEHHSVRERRALCVRRSSP